MSRSCQPNNDFARVREAQRKDAPPPVWESWERTEYRECYYLRLNGTAGALAQALAALPPETTLDLGGDPMGLETPGEGLWYWPKEGSVSVI